jgi:hypothetical protein
MSTQPSLDFALPGPPTGREAEGADAGNSVASPLPQFASGGVDANHDPQVRCKGMTGPLAIHLARNSDPETSHEAARRIIATGDHEQQKMAVLAAVQTWPGRTARELARHTGIAHEIVHKRCPDLRKAGLIENGPTRLCEISGHSCQTWKVRG